MGPNRAVPTCLLPFFVAKMPNQWMKLGSHDTHDAHGARKIRGNLPGRAIILAWSIMLYTVRFRANRSRPCVSQKGIPWTVDGVVDALAERWCCCLGA